MKVRPYMYLERLTSLNLPEMSGVTQKKFIFLPSSSTLRQNLIKNERCTDEGAEQYR
jgi:hypothetical protein